MSDVGLKDISRQGDGNSPSMPEIMKGAIAAGVAPETIAGSWLEFCLNNKDLDAAREVIETCASGLSLLHLPDNWTWPEALAGSPKLRNGLHISQYYQLDDALVKAGAEEEADGVLAQALEAYPTYSGPRLRLADRLYKRKDFDRGDRILVSYIREQPAEMSAVLPYSVRIARNGMTSESDDIFNSALAHGAAPLQIFPYWLEGALRSKDMPAARAAVEACATELGVAPLEKGWTWHDLVTRTNGLPMVGLEVIYKLDDLLLEAGKKDDSESLLQAMIESRQTMSGPVLRLAGRYHADSRWAEGDRVLVNFLSRVPSDEHVVLTLGRRAVRAGLTRDAIRIIRAAIDAGARPGNLVGLWIECCLSAKDMEGARQAVETAAQHLGLSPLNAGWKWSGALARSPALAQGLHLTHYYALEDLHLAENQTAEADAIIRAGMKAYPKISGPFLRYAKRLYDRGDRDAADALLVNFLKETPGDVQVAAMYARQAAARAASNRAR